MTHRWPDGYLQRPVADLEACERPWQIFRRGRCNYCVNLSGTDSAALVTIVDDLVVRIDLAITWPAAAE